MHVPAPTPKSSPAPRATKLSPVPDWAPSLRDKLAKVTVLDKDTVAAIRDSLWPELAGDKGVATAKKRIQRFMKSEKEARST
jgi:hypothetical protein